MKVKLNRVQWEAIEKSAKLQLSRKMVKQAQNAISDGGIKKNIELCKEVQALILRIFDVQERSREAVLNAIDQDIDTLAYAITDKIFNLPEYQEEERLLNGSEPIAQL